MKYPHLSARIFNTPLLIHPGKLDAIIAGLGDRLFGQQIHIHAAGDVGQAGASLAPEMFSTRRGERTERGYRVVDGVAVISVSGALLHRSRFDMAQSATMLGYNDLAADVEDAMAQPDVHAVLKVYDTPGGEAQGAFEFGRRMYDLRGRKPMVSVADGMALSAGYLGASAADELVVTSTGYVGSVGVVARHVDFSRALDADGITVTHIFAGAHKVDGNQFEPLPESVRKDWQDDINGLYGMFVDDVATYRGMDAAVVRKTQAATYSGQLAVAAGLADRISTTDQLISELAARRVRSYPVGHVAQSTAAKGETMSGTNPGGQQAANPSVPAANAGAPLAHTASELAEARAAGVAQGATAERERVSGILNHEGAAGRTTLAVTCITSGLSVEQAGAVLGAAPAGAAAAAAAAAAPGNALASAMNALGNPKVSGVEPQGEQAVDHTAGWAKAFGHQAKPH